MTRINAGIKPSQLIDQHLLAEYRELPRVLTLALKAANNKPIPSEFTLGTGHVRFFYNKLMYLNLRYLSIVTELQQRNVQLDNDILYNVLSSFLDASSRGDLYNDYDDTICRPLLVRRIDSVICNRMKGVPRYYGKNISKEKAIKLLTK